MTQTIENYHKTPVLARRYLNAIYSRLARKTMRWDYSEFMSAFIRTALVVLAMLYVLEATGAPNIVKVSFIGARDSDSHRGAKQGISEANAQGKFLGIRYELITTSDSTKTTEIAPIAILGTFSPSQLLRLSEVASGIPVFNVHAPDDRLREECRANLFHTIPSHAMKFDALQQWRRKHPESTAKVATWHHDFKKYAASQLNQRYEKAQGRPMTSEAWAAWAAVKLVADTIARTQNSSTIALISELQTNISFDGQKGIGLSFRETGQLRQPLLIVESGKIVGEAPVQGIVGGTNLDSLGLPDCPK